MPGNPTALYPRHSADQVAAALEDTPVVLVVGPRQSGKTTLVRQLVAGERSYVTLDEETALQGALSDPVGFVRAFDRVVIDEVQRAPELLRAIKLLVDQDRRPGRFLLTGSANVLTLPHLSESLAGRMAVVELLPLSRSEIDGVRPVFLEAAMDGQIEGPDVAVLGADLVAMVLVGGFPEMLRRRDPVRRRAWARDYLNTLVRRDVSDVADVEHRQRMLRLFQVLALHSGQLTNFAHMGGRVGVDDKTARRYVTILEQLYVVRELPPWFRNRLKRLVKTPKLHFLDSGLLASLLGVTAERIGRERTLFGPLLESFVYSELLRQASWLEDACVLHHYRDKDQDEVDVVVEGADGGIVGVEVKASATVRSEDFRGLRKLSAAAGSDLRLGVVLYDGGQVVPFGGRLLAAPISALWSGGAPTEAPNDRPAQPPGLISRYSRTVSTSSSSSQTPRK